MRLDYLLNQFDILKTVGVLNVGHGEFFSFNLLFLFVKARLFL